MSSSQKSNFSLVVYISRTKEKKNGEVPVLMKININGERVVMQLGLRNWLHRSTSLTFAREK